MKQGDKVIVNLRNEDGIFQDYTGTVQEFEGMLEKGRDRRRVTIDNPESLSSFQRENHSIKNGLYFFSYEMKLQ